MRLWDFQWWGVSEPMYYIDLFVQAVLLHLCNISTNVFSIVSVCNKCYCNKLVHSSYDTILNPRHRSQKSDLDPRSAVSTLLNFTLFSIFLLTVVVLMKVFGSFGLSTKEPHPITLCPSCVVTLASSCVDIVSIVVCAHLPGHWVRHRNCIFSIHVHICPWYVHIKYLVILTSSF